MYSILVKEGNIKLNIVYPSNQGTRKSDEQRVFTAPTMIVRDPMTLSLQALILTLLLSERLHDYHLHFVRRSSSICVKIVLARMAAMYAVSYGGYRSDTMRMDCLDGSAER